MLVTSQLAFLFTITSLLHLDRRNWEDVGRALNRLWEIDSPEEEQGLENAGNTLRGHRFGWCPIESRQLVAIQIESLWSRKVGGTRWPAADG